VIGDRKSIIGAPQIAGGSMAQQAKFELVVHVKTAKALCLTIPQSILVRADLVLE